MPRPHQILVQVKICLSNRNNNKKSEKASWIFSWISYLFLTYFKYLTSKHLPFLFLSKIAFLGLNLEAVWSKLKSTPAVVGLECAAVSSARKISFCQLIPDLVTELDFLIQLLCWLRSGRRGEAGKKLNYASHSKLDSHYAGTKTSARVNLIISSIQELQVGLASAQPYLV